jgi:hypothetical protein
MCILLVGDSNTKLTHLGGANPMVWLWDYHCFKFILCSPLVTRSGVVLRTRASEDQWMVAPGCDE